MLTVLILHIRIVLIVNEPDFNVAVAAVNFDIRLCMFTRTYGVPLAVLKFVTG